jgi:iron complex transport system substrate-binding protein
MKKISITSLILSLILAAILMISGGCTRTAKIDGSNIKSSGTNQSSMETSFPLKLTDFEGREVTIEKEPQRIVSLSPGTTEILFALGAGDKIVGVTSYDDYPPEKVKAIPKVGDFQGPNIEAIVAQKPDIIFASSLSGKDQMEALHKTGLTVVVLEATSFEKIINSIEITAKIMNKQEQSHNIILGMQNKIDEITKKVKGLPKTKVFYLVDTNGNWTAGKGTYIHDLINMAGGENIAGEITGWAQYSLETMVEKNPTVILTAPHAGDVKTIANLPGFKDTEAVKKGNTFVISDDNIISRPSYRIVQGLEEIAKYLHPEAFK